jgi:regulator of RNase E activity RraB
MSLFYTNEEGGRVCVHDFYPEENIYEEKQILLYTFIKFEGDDEELLTIEQKLVSSLLKLKVDYVGWQLNEGWLEFYYYGEIAKGFENAINDALKPTYIFETGNRKDKKYETYYKMLMPNTQEYHNIQSEEIMNDLEEAGDDLSLEHRIEYHVMFQTSSQRKRFLESVLADGFEFLNDFLDEKAEDDYVYGVVFTKLSAVNVELLNEQTKLFFPFIEREHGRYEGWGTNLVTSSEAEEE